MKNAKPARCALILVGVFLQGTNPAFAQTPSRLKGRISDSCGGAVEKTHIVVESRSGKFEAVTNVNGEYDLELPAGTYDVSTRKIPGFVSFTRNKVEVKPGKEKVLNVKLKVTLDDAICVLYVTGAPIKKKEAAGKKSISRVKE